MRRSRIAALVVLVAAGCLQVPPEGLDAAVPEEVPLFSGAIFPFWTDQASAHYVLGGYAQSSYTFSFRPATFTASTGELIDGVVLRQESVTAWGPGPRTYVLEWGLDRCLRPMWLREGGEDGSGVSYFLPGAIWDPDPFPPAWLLFTGDVGDQLRDFQSDSGHTAGTPSAVIRTWDDLWIAGHVHAPDAIETFWMSEKDPWGDSYWVLQDVNGSWPQRIQNRPLLPPDSAVGPWGLAYTLQKGSLEGEPLGKCQEPWDDDTPGSPYNRSGTRHEFGRFGLVRPYGYSLELKDAIDELMNGTSDPAWTSWTQGREYFLQAWETRPIKEHWAEAGDRQWILHWHEDGGRAFYRSTCQRIPLEHALSKPGVMPRLRERPIECAGEQGTAEDPKTWSARTGLDPIEGVAAFEALRDVSGSWMAHQGSWTNYVYVQAADRTHSAWVDLATGSLPHGDPFRQAGARDPFHPGSSPTPS